MLGLGKTFSGVSGGGVRRVVKNGLQLWHKYNVSNAPYGEDIVENGKFALGSERVDDGDFPTGTTAWTSGTGALITGGKLVLTNYSVDEVRQLNALPSPSYNKQY